MAVQGVAVAAKVVAKPIVEIGRAIGRAVVNVVRVTGKSYKHVAASVNKILPKSLRGRARNNTGPTSKSYANNNPGAKVTPKPLSKRAAKRAERRVLRATKKVVNRAGAKQGLKVRRRVRMPRMRIRRKSPKELAAQQEARRNARIERAIRRGERKEERRRRHRERRNQRSDNSRGNLMPKNEGGYEFSRDFYPATDTEKLRDEVRRDSRTLRVLQAVVDRADNTRGTQIAENRSGVERFAYVDAAERASNRTERERAARGRVLEQGIG